MICYNYSYNLKGTAGIASERRIFMKKDSNERREEFVEIEKLLERGGYRELVGIATKISRICKNLPLGNQLRKRYESIDEIVPFVMVQFPEFLKCEIHYRTEFITVEHLQKRIDEYYEEKQNTDKKIFCRYVLSAVKLSLKRILNNVEKELS